MIVLAVAAASTSPPVDAAGVGCRAGRGRVVTQSANAAVTIARARGGGHAWCVVWRPTGQVTLLERSFGATDLQHCCGFSGGGTFLDRVRIAGPYVAYVLREANPKEFDGIDAIVELDARNGRPVVNASRDASLYTDEDWESCVNGPSCFGGILDLALNPDGRLAWIVGARMSSAIYEHPLGGSTTRLDAAEGGAISNLVLTPHTVRWTRNGMPQSVTI